MKYICDHAATCPVKDMCGHNKPHRVFRVYDGRLCKESSLCFLVNDVVRCVPVVEEVK